ncbi:hypothetical protein HMPREF3038_00604 [Akkermansia sp. KLE1797]|nr:hypothetical protein HMPREF3038_00604 [Akkermansia sp. KLE1797]
MPTFTDSIGSPFIEPEVSISKYTGNLRDIIFCWFIYHYPCEKRR